MNEVPDFFNYVLWSDEATFRSNGEVNRHNMRYWAYENPHWMRAVDNQRYWTLNTWCGIIGERIIGPHFLKGIYMEIRTIISLTLYCLTY